LGTFAVSPDGQWLAYSAEVAPDRRRRIFVRRAIDTAAQVRELSGTIGGSNPFFSPDSRSVAYFSGDGLWRIQLEGGAEPFRVADAPRGSSGGTWVEDGRIVFAPAGTDGLVEVSTDGGAASPLTTLHTPDGELEHSWPHALPGGAIVFTVSQSGRDPHLEVLARDKTRKRLRVPVAGQSQFVEPGYLVYGYLGNLMAVRFDAAKHETLGAPVAVAKGLQTVARSAAPGRAGFAVSRTGTLVWVRATAEDARSRLVRVARSGSYDVMPAAAEVYQTPRLSPDQRRLAVVVRPGVITREIRVLDAARPSRVLFTISGGDNQSPAWMDDRRLTFGSNRDGVQKIYVVTLGGAPTPLFTATVAAARNPATWIRSTRLLALYEIDRIRRRDVLVYRVGESVVPVAVTNANERSPAVSPDGKWIAYVSDASGRDELYMKSLEGSTGPELRITSGGAAEPVWTREGLFYRDGERVMLYARRSAAAGVTREIFEGDFGRDPGGNLAAYDIDRRGNFIMLKSALAPRELRVVQNWATELGQLLNTR
jgi:serine/threonine-protein kinase